MIGKIKKGSGFKGCVNYVLGKEQAALLHADGVLTESRGDIIRSFCMQTGMNPDRKSTRLNSSHSDRSRMPSSA